MTANVTEEEKKAVPHHMIGFLPLECQSYNVLQFRKEALEKVQAILTRGKTPIIVGGSNYYLESLIFSVKEEVTKSPLSLDDRARVKEWLDIRDFEQLKKFSEERKLEVNFHWKDERKIRNQFQRMVQEERVLNLDYEKPLFKSQKFLILENADQDFAL